MIYRQLARFLLPLVLTVVVQELGGQVLTGGMARVPQPAETLASYGLAWGIVSLLVSPLNQVKQLGLVLAENRVRYEQLRRYVATLGAALAVILVLLALTPLGIWVVEGLHGVSHEFGLTVRQAILWLSPFPLIRGVTLFHSGLLLRIRRADFASVAILANIGASVSAVFGLLPIHAIQRHPILLPVFVIYAGALAELVVVLWGYGRYLRGKLTDSGGELSLSYITAFFWPLALITMIQGLSRPIINLFIVREAGGAQALAVLTVVYSLAHVFYGWLNEIRSLPTAFRDNRDSRTAIFRFAWACGLFSLGLMIGMFWTPIRGYVLVTLIGLSPELTELARSPLMVFSFFPLAVMNRAYLHGIGLIERRTLAMAPSAFARIGSILAILTVTPAIGLHGATRGITALFCGFCFETLVLWWGIRGGVLRSA